MSEAMHQQTLPSPYCAFSTSRAYAAQHRNYGNCQDCKKAHQKCNGSDGSACDRCIKLKKRCSLLGAASPAGVNSVMESHTSNSVTQRRPSRAEETQRFGEILYARPTDGGTRVEVLHARLGINGIRQVYRTKCDQNFTPVAPTEYLGPWDEFLARMRASMTAVNVQDMFMMAFESKML